MSKRIITINMIMVASILSGCSKNNADIKAVGNEISQVSDINSNGEFKLNKIKYQGLSMNVKNEWERVDLEDMCLYKIDKLSNFSITCQEIGAIDIDSYMKEVKKALSSTIDVEGVSIKKESYNGYDGRSIEYTYDLNGESISVYQICFVKDKFAYVITLCSQENSIKDHKYQIKECLRKLKIK